MRPPPIPLIRRLNSGYWHARWTRNLWLQWPCNRDPKIEDGFGWITVGHVEAAKHAAALHLALAWPELSLRPAVEEALR